MANADALESTPRLPRLARTIDLVGRSIERCGGLRRMLDPDAIVARAAFFTRLSRRLRLTDWGESPQTREALRLLCRVDRDACGMTFFGRFILHGELVRIIKNRLEITYFLKQHPQILERDVARPLVVVGLPRTGTSLLQNLLAQDPAARFLRYWEVFELLPVPRPGNHSDRRIELARSRLERTYRHFPHIKAIHYTRHDGPEECLALLKNSLLEPVRYALIGGFREYQSWCLQQDMSESYGYFRKQLQLLQWNYQTSHWVLKAPSHMMALDSLLSVFPDASVVQIHRPLKQVVPSAISLVKAHRQLYNRADHDGWRDLPLDTIELLKSMLERAADARSRLPADRFLDLDYRQLVDDPVATVKRIYDRFGYPYGEDYERKMRAYLDAFPKSKFGRHRYSLGEYGLTEEDLGRHFGDYAI